MRRYRAITAENASRQAENYVLQPDGLALGDAPATRPDLVSTGALLAVDSFAGPMQPAWGWQSTIQPGQGMSPGEVLTAMRSNPAEQTAPMERAVRQQIALAGYGHMGATAEDAGNTNRGGYVDYQPVPFAGQPEC